MPLKVVDTFKSKGANNALLNIRDVSANMVGRQQRP